MSTNGPTDGKSTVLPRSDAQIVHAVCHDCPEFEDLYQAKTAAEAKAEAVIDAIDHARATGHENVDTKLLTEPEQPICDDCDEPVQASVHSGPDAKPAHAPCDCKATEASD